MMRYRCLASLSFSLPCKPRIASARATLGLSARKQRDKLAGTAAALQAFCRRSRPQENAHAAQPEIVDVAVPRRLSGQGKL